MAGTLSVGEPGAKAKNGPVLSIVIPSFGLRRLDDVIQLLESIKNQREPNVEVIFVADKSQESEELAARVEEAATRLRLPTQVLRNQGKGGASRCRNLGILASRSEIVAILDDDVVLFPGWLEEMLKSYSTDPAVVGVTGPAIPLWEDKDMSWFPKEFYWMWGCTVWDWGEVREIRNVGGMNCSFKREALIQARLYLPTIGPTGGEENFRRFLGGEEVELSLRIRKLVPGSRIIYNPRIKVYHKVHRSRFTWRFMANRAFHFGYSKGFVEKLFRKHLADRTVLDLERDHLRHILLRMLPSLASELPRAPRSAARKAAVVLIGTLFTGLGYLAYWVKPYEAKDEWASSAQM